MPEQIAFALTEDVWIETRDGDPDVRSVFDRHYSRKRYADGRRPKLFCGPGEKVVLRTAACDAILVWRKFTPMDTQRGVSCAVFRNEGRLRSSDLILAAMEIAWRKWGSIRLYTYVDPRRVRSSNPGYCFQAAGWRRVGVTSDRGLVILAHDPFRRSFPSEAVREVPAGGAGARPGLRPE